MSLLIVGCGYVGRHVARGWLDRGEPVSALTRGGPSVEQLLALGIRPIIGDWLETHETWPEPAPQCILVAVPHRPDERFGEQSHVVGLSNLIKRWPDLKRLVVLSTTGVYHQTDGQSVDERSPTEPTRPGPRIALAAERWLADTLPATQATSLRLAGIYGPGRVPLIAKLRQRESIPVAEGVLNLVHRDDITTAIDKLLIEPPPSRLYVLSDGHPVQRQQFYEDAARIFGTPPPLFAQPDPNSTRAGRGETNKRIDSSRIFRELSLNLRYEDHIAGLTAIAREG